MFCKNAKFSETVSKIPDKEKGSSSLGHNECVWKNENAFHIESDAKKEMLTDYSLHTLPSGVQFVYVKKCDSKTCFSTYLV